VIRPCDTKETAAAWAMALKRTNGPTALILTRQNLPLLAESGQGLYQGAYILRDEINPATGQPDVLLMASGSEVELIYNAQPILKAAGIHARVISMPCMEIFDAQPEAYKESIMPKAVRARLAVEAASPFGWHKYTGLDGELLTINGFGASEPAGPLFVKFGFTVDEVVARARKLV